MGGDICDYVGTWWGQSVGPQSPCGLLVTQSIWKQHPLSSAAKMFAQTFVCWSLSGSPGDGPQGAP